MKKLFQYVLDHYRDGTKKVDSDTKIYEILINDIPMTIKNFLNRDDDLMVQGSMGRGNKTDYPWVSILNKDITRSTQEGLYVVYLFRSDMNGFYLTLSQGITNFEKKYGKDKYKYLEEVSNYFKQEFNKDIKFSKDPIDLVSTRGSRGYGYEKSTIISKYYDSDNFTEKELFNDLKDMIDSYDLIYQHMQDSSYDTLINAVINEKNVYMPAYEAIPAIGFKLEEATGYPRYNKKQLTEVKAKSEKSTRFKRIIEGSNTKIDYLKKAQQDAYTGLEGEMLVLSYEQDRLSKLGLSDYVDKVEWISQQNDVAGYDIRSYDIDENGNIYEVYIEVKTSTSKVDIDFFVSKNEVETSHQYGYRYQVFRIYNISSMQPKFYIAKGKIEDNFQLEPVTFRARYKWNL